MLVLCFKHIISNVRVGELARQNSVDKLARDSVVSAVRCKNRCLYTNRAKSVIRFFWNVPDCISIKCTSGALSWC